MISNILSHGEWQWHGPELNRSNKAKHKKITWGETSKQTNKSEFCNAQHAEAAVHFWEQWKIYVTFFFTTLETYEKNCCPPKLNSGST